MPTRIPILALAAALAACGGSPPPAPAKPAAPAPKKEAPKSELLEDVPAVSEYTYSPVGKRDPFRSVLDEMAERAKESSLTPDCGPLCKWELEQLKLVAVISGMSNPVAMVEDPQGKGYVVRRGTFLGKRNGKVTQIRAGEIVVTEIFKDQMGKPHPNQVLIKIPPDKKHGEGEEQNLLGPEVAE